MRLRAAGHVDRWLTNAQRPMSSDSLKINDQLILASHTGSEQRNDDFPSHTSLAGDHQSTWSQAVLGVLTILFGQVRVPRRRRKYPAGADRLSGG